MQIWGNPIPYSLSSMSCPERAFITRLKYGEPEVEPEPGPFRSFELLAVFHRR